MPRPEEGKAVVGVVAVVVTNIILDALIGSIKLIAVTRRITKTNVIHVIDHSHYLALIVSLISKRGPNPPNMYVMSMGNKVIMLLSVILLSMTVRCISS